MHKLVLARGEKREHFLLAPLYAGHIQRFARSLKHSKVRESGDKKSANNKVQQD